MHDWSVQLASLILSRRGQCWPVTSPMPDTSGARIITETHVFCHFSFSFWSAFPISNDHVFGIIGKNESSTKCWKHFWCEYFDYVGIVCGKIAWPTGWKKKVYILFRLHITQIKKKGQIKRGYHVLFLPWARKTKWRGCLFPGFWARKTKWRGCLFPGLCPSL